MQFFVVILILASATSCASMSHNVQPQVNQLVASNNLEKALTVLGDNPAVYRPRNRLLFWLDKAMAEHLAFRTQASIKSFEQAEKLNEALYTKSLSQIASTWIVNDLSKDYRADEQENVMINVLQSLNFAIQGDLDEALVDVRRIDSKMKQTGERYRNPFAYFLSGMLWQVSNDKNAADNALIDYKKAADIYDNPPRVLQELTEEAKRYQREHYSKKARVYVLIYAGFIPEKISESIIIPIDQTHLTRISFPRYEDRPSSVRASRVKLYRDGVAKVEEAEVVCDLGTMARKILEERKWSMMAKAMVRPMIKYGVERALEEPVRDKAGDLAADLLGILGSVYSIMTEQADVRGWQSLPNKIEMAYFDLEPGTYHISVEDVSYDGTVIENRIIQAEDLKSGEARFFISRSRL